ncbi:MAG: cytochrome c [Gemmatimonadota bacterium]|nr:MAG: cytochrome c [Gemmatimonadota bacterium]
MNATWPLTLLVAVAAAGACTSEIADEIAATASSPDSHASPSATSPIDSDLAARGEKLFQSKGCGACHTIGEGNRTGPDLEGVADRRAYGWIAAMIMDPDSMIETDPIAKQLLAEYMTPMLNMAVTADEARSMYEYLRLKQ